MKFPFLFVLAACFCCDGLQAQPTPSTMNVKYPQPPDVASLLRFTETPVSYFNGTANISIPLYTMKAGDLSFPITLSYHSSGIKVDEEAGIVGLGWSLSTVAAITETNPMAAQQNAIAPAIVPDGAATLPANVSDHFSNLVMNGEVFMDTNGVCHTVPAFSPEGPNGNQYEPDLFIMSANGISCKFFVPNGMPRNNWVNADGSNIRIVGDQPQGGGAGGSFTAILPDGTKYIFSDGVYTTNISLGIYGSTNAVYSRTYYLTEIISPRGKTMQFNYLNSGTVPQTLSQQGFSEIWAYDNATKFTSGATITPSSTIQNKYLNIVYFDNGFAQYHYSGRDDIQGGYKLDAIDIFRQGESAAVRTISFQYDYYDFPKGNWGDFITDGQMVGVSLINGPPEQYRRKRLKLLSVQVNQDPPYTFNYDNNPLPYKTSFAQDLWGYFNGGMVKTLLPNYNTLGYLENGVPQQLLNSGPVFTFADRSAQFPFTKAGILEQITYPTGGYTRFQYQPNSFGNPESASTIADTLVFAEDIGGGQQTVEFDVPAAGFVSNPATISIQLICGGGNGTCALTQGYSGGCTGYTNTNNTNGLFALLQRQNPSGGGWLPDQSNVFDFSNSSINNNPSAPCGSSGIAEQLTPGHYRIIASYPDNRTDGSHGGPSAFISVKYKITKQIAYPNVGGGLRISGITDFDAGGQMAHQRRFTYSAGMMMTKPIFYRYLQGSRPGGTSASCLPDPATEWGIPMTSFCLPQTGETNPPANVNYNRSFLVLYNNPVIPYSYSADGSPVGYDSVYEARVDGQGNDQGRTIYLYAARPDSYLFYGTNMPGTPSTADLNNGELMQELVQQRVGNNYVTLHAASYTYAIANRRTYFGYRVEYMPNYRTDGSEEFICLDPNSQFVHFYPIKTGHRNLVNKVEQDLANGITLTTTADYTYNTLNQVATETTTRSNGKTLTHKTWYPGDYTGTGDVTATMRSLNMLDYPVESISTVNNLAVDGIYTQYLSHDNIVTPATTYTLASAQPVAITPSAPGNTPDGHYEPRMNYTFDGFGNQLLSQKVNGPATNYLWDYHHSLPVAEVRNASPNDYAYTSWESDGTGNWVYMGTPVADPTAPAGRFSYPLSLGAVTMPAMNASETYVLGYWTNNGSPYSIAGNISNYPIQVRSLNGWNYYVHKLTGQSSLSITGGGNIDDLRLYPDKAQMRTSIYDPLFGVTALSDLNGKTEYYEYDGDMRLKNIRDLQGNIIRNYQYGYWGFDQANNYTVYHSAAITTTVRSNKCSVGFVGFGFGYEVPEGTYTSYISQTDADGKAQNEVRTTGQEYANVMGGCQPAACLAPQVTGVTSNGTGFTLNYTGMQGATMAFVNIVDVTTGNMSQPPSLSPTSSSGTFTGTVPAAGHMYSFQIRMSGPGCPGSIFSNQVNVQF